MENTMSRISIILLTLVTVTHCLLSSQLHVPGNYPTIQAAIVAAAEGDTVLVDPGTYFENINFKGKNIVVSSLYILTADTSTIFRTVINGGTPLHPDTGSCVLFISHETSAAVLEGFTLTGGSGTKWPDSHIGGLYREGGGILTENSSPTIRNNRIVGNHAVDVTGVTSAGGGAIRSDGGTPLIVNNVITNNTGRYGAGIVLNFTGAVIRNNVIASNSGGQDFGGSGIWANENGPTPKIVENNTIVDNVSSLDGGGVLSWGTSITLHNNIIWGNSAPVGSQIRLRGIGTVAVSYCDVQGGWTGSGNIDQDPILSCLGYYLMDNSPCIDRGDNTVLTDLDPSQPENPDSAEWPSKGSTRNDLGAYGGPDRAILPLDDNFSPPLLVSPSNDEGGVSTSPILSWGQAECAEPFYLQVSTDSTFVTGMISSDSAIADTFKSISGLQEFKTYYWRVRSARSIHDDGWSPVWKFTVAAFGFTASVARGWNMVSLAVNRNDASLSAVFPAANSQLYIFLPDSGYLQKTLFSPGAGYWLKFPDSENIVISGLARSNDTIPLNQGWNMIGSVSSAVSAGSVSTEPSGILTSRFWTYRHGYRPVDSIMPFGGYWIKAGQSGQLILDSAAMTGKKIPSSDGSLVGLKRLWFRDEEWNSQTLYYDHRTPGTVAEFSEMPPVLDGMFDVRFASGRVAESLGDGEYPIQVTSPAYPVSIAWESGNSGVSLVVDGRVISTSQAGETKIYAPGSRILLKTTDKPAIPGKFMLYQNYPNPFNPATNFHFSIASRQRTILTVYGMLGQAVETLVDEVKEPGEYTVSWDASRFASGVYVYSITSGAFTERREMLLVR